MKSKIVDKMLEDMEEKNRKIKEKEQSARRWVVNDQSTAIDHFGHSLSLMLLNVSKAVHIVNLSAAITLLIFKQFEIGDPSFAKEAIEACQDLEK